jgi:hypothetical protein
MQLIYWLSILVLPGLPWWAVTTMGGHSPDAGTARLLFGLGALWATVIGMTWLCSVPYSPWVRVPAGLLVGAYVFVGLPQSLSWVGSRARHPPARPPAATAPNASTPQPQPTRPPTFREVFDHDFGTLPGLYRNVGLQSAKTGEKTSVPVRLLVEMGTHEKFLSVFIERNTSSFNTCVFFLYNVDLVFQEMNVVPLEKNVSLAAATLYAKDFAFDHNIYFYMAEDMSREAQTYLEKAFRDQGVYAHFRGSAYYAAHWHDADLQQPAMDAEMTR